MRLREFFKSLWADWMALMSGIASLALAFWAAYFPPTDITAGRALLWFAAGVCFAAATYRIWSREHNARLEAERLLVDERQQKTPELSGRIEQVVTGDIPNVGAQVFVYLAISNAGAQSVAEGWALRIEGPDLDLTVRPTHIPEEFPLFDGTGKMVAKLYGRDAVYEKAMTPIERGNVIRGPVRYIVEGIIADQIRRPGNKLTISFSDFLGNQYSVSYTYTGIKIPPMYLPGSGSPFASPEPLPPQPKQTIPRRRKGRRK